MRSRVEEVAFTSDIEAMFYQVRIPPAQRSFRKFLWRENGILTKNIADYQTCVHVFDSTSSPSCSTYSLRRTAIDNNDTYGVEAANTILRNFYADDLLKSHKLEKPAIALIKDMKGMCQPGGFNLTKFSTNSKTVYNFIISIDDGAKGYDNDKIRMMVHFNEKTLGIHWKVKDNKFGFEMQLKETLFTRRGLLSAISDLLGLVAPFMLESQKLI